MTARKTVGFYDFHISADKTRDFLIKNDFGAANVLITKFDSAESELANDNGGDELPLKDDEKAAFLNDMELRRHHNAVIDFFKRLFHIDAGNSEQQPAVNGFILSVITDSPERASLASEILTRHGATFVDQFDN